MALPRYAILKNIGKVRVLEYREKDTFWVLDNKDQKRLVHRNQLTFVKR